MLQNVSFKIPQNTVTAIVGPSGSGKSTICNLIARFWDVDEGKVTLGGVNVKDYSMNNLMNNFSFVFQTVYLFADTIENNIKFGRQDATHEEVIAAAKKACCHEFISQLPNGYDTVIGEGGSSLSGGQKQRVAISRAVLKNSEILIFDDATSALDLKTEADLYSELSVKKYDVTRIIIAQRIASVKNADRIVVMDNGRLADVGSHSELIKTSEIYKDIYESQLKGNE